MGLHWIFIKICALFIENHLKMSTFNFSGTLATLDFFGSLGAGGKGELSASLG